MTSKAHDSLNCPMTALEVRQAAWRMRWWCAHVPRGSTYLEKACDSCNAESAKLDRLADWLDVATTTTGRIQAKAVHSAAKELLEGEK